MSGTQVNINVIQAAAALDGQRALNWDRGFRVAASAFSLAGIAAFSAGHKDLAVAAMGGVALSTLLSIPFSNAARRTVDANYIPSARSLRECRERMQALSPNAEVIVGYDLNRK